jgi:hypothetical protein
MATRQSAMPGFTPASQKAQTTASRSQQTREIQDTLRQTRHSQGEKEESFQKFMRVSYLVSALSLPKVMYTL